MRNFDYRRDYSNIRIDVKSYINQFTKELNTLIDIEGLDVYKHALKVVQDFNDKYKDLDEIYKKIFADILSPENVDYAFKNGHYKEDASLTGVEFQKDLYRLFELEEELSIIASEMYRTKLTPFEQINNGDDFIIVGHASYQLPGVKNNPNYRKNQKEYLSCSLFSNKELNVFMDHKIVYLVDVNQDNFISSSYFDVVTRQTRNPSIFSIKKIELDNGEEEYIDIGFTFDKDKFALSILTPRAVEELSTKREEEQYEKYKTTDMLTNEIVLYRKETTTDKALLIAEETDLLLDEYIVLKSNNVEFKCINKGLYKEKMNKKRFDREKLDELKQSLSHIYRYGIQLLINYYKEVVLNMNYSDEVLSIINKEFSKYIDIDSMSPDGNARLKK